MGKWKRMRWIAFRAAGVASALALASLALVASPAAATSKSTTTVVTATTPAYTGAPIVFTATVTHNALTPTGTVTFSIVGADSSTPTCDGGNNTITLSPATTGSSAQCSIGAGLFADASPYSVTATYSPADSTFATSVGTLAKVVHKGPTTTMVTSASDPSVTGQPVSFTAVVAPTSPSTGVPTGSVTFSIAGGGGTTVNCDSGDIQALDSSGTAQCSVAAGLLAAYTPYTVTAAYSGDPNYATSTGSVTQNVARAIATIGVTSSSPSLVTGQPVMFTATVTGINPPGAGTPTGKIVFSVVGSDGTSVVCDGGDTVPLSGLSAVCNFSAGLPAQSLTYTVSATLQDPNFKSPIAGTLVQQVNKAATTVKLSGLPGSLVASQGFTFDATIKTVAPGTGAPTGDFEWAVCPNLQPCTPQTGTKGGTYVLPTPTNKEIAKSKNEAVISVPGGLTPGFYDVTASFVGDGNLMTSTSTAGHILVTPIPTKMDLILGRNPTVTGAGLKIKAGIIADSRATPSLGAPSGTVTFTITGASGDSLTCHNGSDNVITISTTAQNQGLGKCAITAGQLTEADSPYKIKAVYSGDSYYAAVKGSASLKVETAR